LVCGLLKTGVATFLVSFASSFGTFLAEVFAGDTEFLADFFTPFSKETVLICYSDFTGQASLAGDAVY
jgi:hypothetical protein